MANSWVARGNLKGPKGDPGDAGAAGRGVQSAAVNTGGHLILTYTDGVQVDLGDVTGEDGAGVAINGSVATYAALPTGLTQADAGDAYLVNADGLLYVWSGTAWPANGAGVAFRGPAGAQGIQGVPGVRGTRWQDGAGNPGAVPGDALPGDYYLNSVTGEYFQVQDL